MCVVWVGYDDYRDLELEGAESALPVWTQFMKRAVGLLGPQKSFRPPAGIVSEEIDPDTGLLATRYCPSDRMEFFIAGTQPREACSAHWEGESAAELITGRVMAGTQ